MNHDHAPCAECTEAARVIDGLGGTLAAARFFGIRPGSVSEWRLKGLPAARRRHLLDVRPELINAGLKPVASVNAHAQMMGANAAEASPLLVGGTA